ncbi:YciI family protein [Wenxinia marina]|uniref:YCII-related domain-containing protein n=1 Tax=Wenxinia marina DSM 24838 TaxID=1123501 RepID=A0A0D0NQ51_9RHOB|nr:YciI family protein [Wenxinia marina]KIQ70410.1 hypothetical protein Wenmar_00786 [Wenxinia marina DSM 24838]GGL53406.1 hypothetical protein GCM10011392_04670 [Wenxinia marina]
MRIMVIVKADEESEAGKMPSQGVLEKMLAYNTELVEAGIMVDGDGLKASSAGKRITFDGKERTVTDGPFAEIRELVSGYWIWEVRDMDEAVEWARRAPFVDGQLELRPFNRPEDFGEAFTPEMQAAEEELRARSRG